MAFLPFACLAELHVVVTSFRQGKFSHYSSSNSYSRSLDNDQGQMPCHFSFMTSCPDIHAMFLMIPFPFFFLVRPVGDEARKCMLEVLLWVAWADKSINFLYAIFKTIDLVRLANSVFPTLLAKTLLRFFFTTEKFHKLLCCVQICS